MKVNLDTPNFKHASKLLTFVNRSKDPIANFFSITNSYLWRRDGVRLVALETSLSFSGNFNYELQHIHDLLQSDSFELSNNGVISLYKGNNMGKIIHPSNKELFPHSISTIKNENYHFSCTVPSILLTRHISVIQRILDANKLDLDKHTIVFDFENQTCFIKELPEESFELPFENKNGALSSIAFSFSYFKDLLFNASKFDKELVLQVFNPYYAVFRYQKDLSSSICLLSND